MHLDKVADSSRRCREKGAFRTNRYSLMCAIQFILLLNQQFGSKHNVSVTWKTFPDLRASLYKLLVALELQLFPAKLSYQILKGHIIYTSEPISWGSKDLNLQPQCFFTWNLNSDAFQVRVISISKTLMATGFNSQPGSWPADQSSAGPKFIVQPFIFSKYLSFSEGNFAHVTHHYLLHSFLVSFQNSNFFT